MTEKIVFLKTVHINLKITLIYTITASKPINDYQNNEICAAIE